MRFIASAGEAGTTDVATREGIRVPEESGAAEDSPLKEAQTSQLTWARLKSAFFEFLKVIGKAKQIGNYATAIKFFLEAQYLTEESLVGDELGNEFEAKIKVYVEFQVDRKIKKHTYDPRVSKIRAVKLFRP
jgi:hypothetical protein